MELQDVSLWIKYGVYDMVFCKEMYDRVLKALPADEPVSEYFKCFTYGGVLCAIIKILNFDFMIKKLTELKELTELTESQEMNSIVRKAFADTFEEKRKEELDLILQMYLDSKKFYPEDPIFADIVGLIKSNELPIDIDTIC